ncbi:hypothetical protein [Cupriavidus sp. UYPR2.512]|uniref:hypothetical protein n=1 Tax=Cupriavidus sp. UYPR2.512 TaxID=1080187 RepID=UPI00039ACE45|nr:hypothetical protein [Cupriavidus sp. UYPR2.512]UIF89425.1 hypothetical protein KAF44_29590 [Cupriavidus necator]
MSDAIQPPCLATARPATTVVKAGPFVIRHPAPGKPFLQLRGGEYVLIHPTHPDEMPRISIPARLRYRIKLWLISRQGTWNVSALASFRSTRSAHRSPRSQTAASRWRVVLLARVQGGVRAVLSVDVKAVGRGAMTTLLAFMALIGATRFVHVDVETVFHSFHFSIPHFLTPWRSEDDSAAPAQNGRYAAVQYFGNITPSTFTPPAVASSPQANDDTSPSRKADKGWLPLPGGGPFPMNMPDYGEDGQKRPFPLKVRPSVFTPPEGPGEEEVGSSNAVRLLGAAATPVPAPVESTSTPAAVHATPKKEGASRAVSAQAANEPVTPREGFRPAPPPKHPQHQTVQQPQSPNRDTVDVQLRPAATQPAPVAPRAQSDDSLQGQEQAGSSDGKPKFKVITKNGDALVVMDRGQMKQISVGQTLPDGSTLLSVKQNGGGFTTSRGNYVAY